MHIDIEIELLGGTAVIGVEYDWYGMNRPATMTDPEEFAELEVGCITRKVDDNYVDVTSFFNEADMKFIESEVLKALSEDLYNEYEADAKADYVTEQIPNV